MRICIWTLLTLCIVDMNCYSQQNFKVALTEDERLERLYLDFSMTEEELYRKLSFYGLHENKSRIDQWVSDKKIESRIINGERRYFKNAVSNLFRLDSSARAIRDSIAPLEEDDVWVRIPQETAIRMLEAKGSNGKLYGANEFEVNFSMIVPASSLDSGDEFVRCWIPAPQLLEERQKKVDYLNSQIQDNNLREAPAHASVFLEKKRCDSKDDIVFETKYRFKSYAQHYSLKYLFEHEKKQNPKSEAYLNFIGEYDNHIIFTREIRMLGDSLKDLCSDVQTIKNIFDYISYSIPWCSAVEYGNIDNIPMYVLQNKHGDCGQVSLLFLTLCRYCGIPAKWQSGWMLHPGAENLHDWTEVFIEGVGWIPVDVSFGKIDHPDTDVSYFYLGGIDSYRLVVNEDISSEFLIKKRFFRSEPIDFQRGEVETNRRNLYFNKWKYKMRVKNCNI